MTIDHMHLPIEQLLDENRAHECDGSDRIETRGNGSHCANVWWRRRVEEFIVVARPCKERTHGDDRSTSK